MREINKFEIIGIKLKTRFLNKIIKLRGKIFVENSCSKCKTLMVEPKLDSFPVRVFKSGEKPNSKTMSDISPCYVCPNCGFIELYATKPENFK